MMFQWSLLQIKYTSSKMIKNYYRNVKNQKQIFVNCANRKEVVDILGWGWQKLRQQGIAGVTEDMCYKPYIRAKELHPSISFDGVAQTFLMECNMGLQYLK